MFSFKKHVTGDNTILAVADKDILDKSFEQGRLVLSVPSSFYSEKEADEKEILEHMSKSTIVNAVGKDIVDLLIRKNIIKKENTLTVRGVPHAQIIRM